MEYLCKFDRGWAGRCKQPADQLSDRGMCVEHDRMKCCSCGQPATQECDHTGIQFVCGYPLCDGCSHSAPADPSNPGLFNLGGGHKPKEEARAAWEKYNDLCEQRYAEQHKG
jgi:hypothetical protein